MNKIGLTGNIASGKSEVEKILSNLGYNVVDLDKVTHKLYQTDIVKIKLEEVFKTFDRNSIANIVFNDKSKLKKLEEIFHPILKEYIKNIKSENITFISGALIYEAKFDCLFDKIVFVTADFDIRLNRLMLRNNLSKEEAIKRISFQNSKYISKADYIIENNATKEDLKQKVTVLLSKILK